MCWCAWRRRRWSGCWSRTRKCDPSQSSKSPSACHHHHHTTLLTKLGLVSIQGFFVSLPISIKIEIGTNLITFGKSIFLFTDADFKFVTSDWWWFFYWLQFCYLLSESVQFLESRTTFYNNVKRQKNLQFIVTIVEQGIFIINIFVHWESSFEYTKMGNRDDEYDYLFKGNQPIIYFRDNQS